MRAHLTKFHILKEMVNPFYKTFFYIFYNFRFVFHLSFTLMNNENKIKIHY